jgi:uncharacterized membrane protein
MVHNVRPRFIGIGALALVAGAVSLLVDTGPLATIAGLVVLILPGPVVAEALLPRRAASVLERLAWGIAAAFVVTVGAGLALSQVSEVTRRGWAVALTAVTLVGLAVGTVSEQSTAATADPARRDRRRAWPVVGVAAASVLMVVAAVAISVDSDRHVSTTSFSELWMLPANADGAVVVGVRSHQPSAATYRVELMAGATRWRSWTVAVRPGREWQVTVAAPDAELRCRLYLNGGTSPYRSVDLAPSARNQPADPGAGR